MTAWSMPLRERFMRKVRVSPAPFGCWEWTAAHHRDGYGRFHTPARLVQAHRWLYEQTYGPVDSSLDLDHGCRNPACVNPLHLEPVTRRTNLMRGNTLARAHHERRDCGFEGCASCTRFRETAA